MQDINYTMLRVMKRARGKIRSPKNWTQHAFLRRNGKVRCWQWCAVGAIHEAIAELNVDYDVAYHLTDWLSLRAGRSIVTVNDQPNKRKAHVEVMRLFGWLIDQLTPAPPPLAPAELHEPKVASEPKAESEPKVVSEPYRASEPRDASEPKDVSELV